MDTESGDRLLRIGEMLVLTGYSRSSIYRKMRDGSFPQALKIGARAVRWQESEIVAWRAACPRATGDTPP